MSNPDDVTAGGQVAKPAQVAHTTVPIPEGYKLVPEAAQAVVIPEGYKLVIDDSEEPDTRSYWCLMFGAFVLGLFPGALSFLGMLLLLEPRQRRRKISYAKGAAVGTALNVILYILLFVWAYGFFRIY